MREKWFAVEGQLAAGVNAETDVGSVPDRLLRQAQHVNFHLLLAGLATAAEYGLTHEAMLDLAETTYVDGNVFSDEKKMRHLEALPASCVRCAGLLEERRGMYEDFGVFPATVIDHQIRLLRKENDEHLNSDFSKLPAEERLTATRELMHKDIHRH